MCVVLSVRDRAFKRRGRGIALAMQSRVMTEGLPVFNILFLVFVFHITSSQEYQLAVSTAARQWPLLFPSAYFL